MEIPQNNAHQFPVTGTKLMQQVSQKKIICYNLHSLC